mmetsp:Transcript_36085/g.55420  ORF Transcript_36085/g.55420 Transcript_36085/m.55420 type:complete len:99 (-) Transcript_36085:223-519(-)
MTASYFFLDYSPKAFIVRSKCPQVVFYKFSTDLSDVSTADTKSPTDKSQEGEHDGSISRDQSLCYKNGSVFESMDPSEYASTHFATFKKGDEISSQSK